MKFHLAQINIGRLVAPIDDPKIAEFVTQLDAINAIADGAGICVAPEDRIGECDGCDVQRRSIRDREYVRMGIGGIATGLCLQIGACESYAGPGEVVREDGEAALLFVVGARGTHLDRCRRSREAGTLSSAWRDAVFLLVFSAISTAGGRKHSCLRNTRKREKKYTHASIRQLMDIYDKVQPHA
jgi:hypothetical protein